MESCLALHVLARKSGKFRERAFREVVGNGEGVINWPGVDILCISLSRWPYDEYHTSDDNPDIIEEEMLFEAADAVEEIARIYCIDYAPMRLFRGPLLSRYGLWVDWRSKHEMNPATEKITLNLEGTLSVFEIAEKLGLDLLEDT